jgi:hypothetical protein
MRPHLLSVCIAAVLLSLLSSLALTTAPAQACGKPIIIGYRPTEGDTVADTYQMVAEVRDSKVAVEMVLFMVDGALVAVAKTPTTGTTYAADLKPSSLADGEHKWRAAALLADGTVLNSEAIVFSVINPPASDTK